MYFHTEKRSLLDRIHCTIDGKKISMPRFYKDKIYDKMHKEILIRHAKQLEEEKELLKEKFDVQDTVESHLAMFKKMYRDKYKGKSL